MHMLCRLMSAASSILLRKHYSNLMLGPHWKGIGPGSQRAGNAGKYTTGRSYSKSLHVYMYRYCSVLQSIRNTARISLARDANPRSANNHHRALTMVIIVFRLPHSKASSNREKQLNPNPIMYLKQKSRSQGGAETRRATQQRLRCSVFSNAIGMLGAFIAIVWSWHSVPAVAAAKMQPVALINAGGQEYTDSYGNVWEADSLHAYYQAGGSSGVATYTTADILNTADDALYQTDRAFHASQPGPYLYEIPVPVPGNYTVTLHFSETDATHASVGSRIMDVYVEGTRIYENFDIVAAGGAFKPTTITAAAKVVDGSVTVELIQVKSNPEISAIAVYSMEKSLTEKLLQVKVNPKISAIDVYSTASWLQVHTTGSLVAREEACFVMVNHKAYLIGGRDKKPVNVYDPVQRKWTREPGPGLQLHHMQCVVADNKIWIVSSWTGNCCKEKNVPDIYVYDTTSKKWQKKAGLPEYRLRGAAAAVLYGRDIYVVGGNRGGHGLGNGHVFAWFDKYNIDDNQWTVNLTDAPHARDHTGGGIVNGKLCVASGRDSGAADYFNATVLPTDCYNFDTKVWEVHADIPQGRAGAAIGTTCDGKLMVAGGEGYHEAWNQVDVFDGTSWQTVGSLQVARHGTGLAVDCSCNQIYVASGAGAQGGFPLLDSTETYFPTGVDVSCS